MANSILNILNRNQTSQTPNPSDLAAQAQQAIDNGDPAMQQALAHVKNNGGDPKTALLKLMSERGIPPQVLQNFGIKI